MTDSGYDHPTRTEVIKSPVKKFYRQVMEQESGGKRIYRSAEDMKSKRRVKEFMKKTTYEVKPNEGKCFSEIDIKELVRVHEEVEEEEEDSDDGADAFDDSEVEEGGSEEYDTDDFSEEFTDEEDD